jgi:hypothetical protein
MFICHVITYRSYVRSSCSSITSSRTCTLSYSHRPVNVCRRFSLHSFDWKRTRQKRAFQRHQCVTQQLHFQQWQHCQRRPNNDRKQQPTGASGITHSTLSSPCITFQLLRFEPTNEINFITVTTLQHTGYYMFRHSLAHQQAAHDCTKQLLHVPACSWRNEQAFYDF